MIVVKPALTFGERLRAFRLRLEVFSESGYLDPGRFPWGYEYDEFDILSDIFVAVDSDGDRVVGTIRFVHDGPLGFPSERVFADEIARWRGEMRGRSLGYMEASRIAILRPYRRSRVFPGLMAAMWRYGIEKGIASYCWTNTLEDSEIYIKFGAKLETPEPKSYRSMQGTKAVMMRWDLAETVPRYVDRFTALVDDGSVRMPPPGHPVRSSADPWERRA